MGKSTQKVEVLSAKQAKFVRVYLATGDVYRAYKEAGYYIGKGQFWYMDAKEQLKSPKIERALAGMIEEQKQKMRVDIQDVIDGFLATYNNATAQNDFTNANRSLENLAKYLGMYTGKGENIKKTQDTDELKKDIERLAHVAGAKVSFDEAKAA